MRGLSGWYRLALADAESPRVMTIPAKVEGASARVEEVLARVEVVPATRGEPEKSHSPANLLAHPLRSGPEQYQEGGQRGGSGEPERGEDCRP